MVKADPQLAWLKEAEQRGDVDWRQVKELHDSFKYSNSGLGAGAQIIIAIIVTYFTMGAASGAIAAAGSGTSMASATAVGTAATSAGWANAAGSTVLAGMASNGAISAINNRGNLSTVLKDVTSSDAMKGYVVSGVTAGLTAGVYDKWTGTQTGTSTALPNSGAVATVSPLSTWQGVGQFTANQVLQNGTSLLVDRALGGEARLGDALQSSLANAFAAYGFNLVGDISKNRFAEGGITKIGLHALMGGLAAEASGGDFRTGALAAGVNEALLDSLAKNYADMPDDQKKGLLVMNSQLLGVLAASVQSNADADSLQTGAWVAQNMTQYNFLEHLPPGLSEYGSAATTLAKDMLEKGATNDQIAQAQLKLAQGQGFEGVQPANEFVKAWGYFMAGELTGAGLAAVLGRLVMGGAKGLPSALQNFGGRTFDDLSAAASNPINKEGLTEAARALTKHASGQRATGTFPKLTGGIEKQNATALGIIDDVLKNPNSTFSNLSRGGLEVRAPDGRGLRYNKDGSFSGFLDPKAKP